MPRAFGLALATLLLSPVPSVAQFVVGKNVLVGSAHPDAAHGENLIAADGRDPTRLLVCAHRFPGAEESVTGRRVMAYVSHDGGRRWKATLDAQGGDPACAFGLDGTAYLTNLRGAVGGLIQVYRSTDGGLTWTAARSTRGMDREYIVVDTGGGPYRGRLYINGAHGVLRGSSLVDGFGLYHSADGGTSWEGPVVANQVESPKAMTGMGNAVVLSDGRVVAVFGELSDTNAETPRPGCTDTPYHGCPNARLHSIASRDGGDSFEPVTAVDLWWVDGIVGGAGIPVLAADPGSRAFKDRLYVVWPDRRRGHVEIFLAYSTDNGQSWSTPVVINDEPPTTGATAPDHVLPRVAVNKEGVVGVVWGDRREHAGRPHAGEEGYWLRFRASLDGGVTWQPSARISEKPNAYPPGAAIPMWGGQPNDHAMFGGDTGGLVADADGVFHAVWIDNRTSVPQLWTTTIAMGVRK